MSAADRLAALDDLNPAELCQRTGTLLAALVEVMNAETTLLRAHRYTQAAELTAEKTQLAQDYVGLARAVQHETDHLDGVLFIDRLDQATRKAALKAIREAEWANQPVPQVKVSPHAGSLGGASVFGTRG